MLFQITVQASLFPVLYMQNYIINFKNERYSTTELINILFENEFYSPMTLGVEGQKYFGVFR